MIPLLSKPLRFFSARPNVIQTRGGVAGLPVKSLRGHWIVGRDLCMYRHEDFANVPRSKRRAALALKVPVWSPFERTGYHCVWSGSAAMVWFWDGDTVGPGAGPGIGPEASPEASPEAGPEVGAGGGPPDPPRRAAGADPGPRARILPETVFLARKPDGVHLQACREGFELQYWRADVLVDAFWFPERPDERGLRRFLDRREGGGVLDDEARATPLKSVPEAPGAGLAPEPWSGARTPGEWFEANEGALAAACLLVLSLAVVWQESRYWKIHHLKDRVTSELARMQGELDPLLGARNELLRLRRTNRALSEILGTPSQARLMGLVDRAIPGAAAQFREWRYQQRELSVVVEDPDLDPIAYVRSLEAEPLFDQVRAEPARSGENRIEITLRVRA